jgi:outer membrane lipoprotein-sorting protein
MRKSVLIVCLLAFCANVFSQRQLSENEKAVFEQKIMAQSEKIETLQCAFVQEKTSALVAEKAVAKGVLLYQSSSALRWEYTEPTPSTLILNGNAAALLDKDGKKIGNDKLIKQLGNLIISVINGNGMKNSKQFSTALFETENHQILAALTPVQKRMKEFYQSIDLIIDPKTFLASEIILNEKTGDKTVIHLNNIKINERIDADKFAVK